MEIQMKIRSYEQLAQLSDGDIINEINTFLAHIATTDEKLTTLNSPGQLLYVQFLVNELARRSQDRQTNTMLCYTKWITAMTVVITIATLVSLVLAYLAASH